MRGAWCEYGKFGFRGGLRIMKVIGAERRNDYDKRVCGKAD